MEKPLAPPGGACHDQCGRARETATGVAAAATTTPSTDVSAFRPLVPALLLFAAAAPAVAWEPDGVPVCGVPCPAFKPRVIPDGHGGAFIGWTSVSSRTPTNDDVHLQRLDGDGAVSAGWPAEGIPVCVLSRSQDLVAIAPDERGGVFAAWTDQRCCNQVYVQRINADATLAPGWVADGVSVAPPLGYQTYPAIAADGEGGVFVAWQDARDTPLTGYDVYAQHLLADGSVAPGWSSNGVRVTSYLAGPPLTVARDDSGGVRSRCPTRARQGSSCWT